MNFKWLTVPWSNKTKQAQAVQLWEVRWHSRYGEGYMETRPEIEAFTSNKAATEFAEALKYAYRLLRHTSGTTVTLTKGREV